MLQAIRTRAGSYLVKLLFIVLIAAFGVWGIGDIFRSRQTDTVAATVGGQSIPIEEVRIQLQRTIEGLRSQFGENFDIAQAKRLGLVDNVVDHLVERSLLDQEAARMKLDLSDRVVRGAILADPNFRGADGQFDRFRFQQLLAANRLSEQAYVERLRRDIPANDLLHAASVGVTAPPPLVEALYRYRDEKRVADIVLLPVAALGDIGQPSDADLTAFYESHRDEFRAPEYRGFTLLSLTPADIAKSIKISDEQLQRAFDQDAEDFQLPERREVQQILAPSEEVAKQAAAALAAGKGFREVATTIAKQDPQTIDLGLVERKRLPSALAEIAFDLKPNVPSEPVKSPLGWHILRVVKIEPAKTESFAEAKPKLLAKMVQREAVDRLYKLANQVDDALAGGANIDEIANKFGLKKTVIAAIDVNGSDPAGKPVQLPVEASPVLKLAFATEKGQTSRVEEAKDGALYLLRVGSVTPPQVRPLAAVKPKAVALWQAERRHALAADKAKALAAAVSPGTPLAKAAAAKGLKVTSAVTLSREPDGKWPAELVARLFAAKVGGVVTATDNAGSYVAQLDRVETPKDAGKSADAVLSRQIETGLTADLQAEFTSALRRRFPVEVNRDAVDKMF
jgi:peptidyl-prolyl cis-trans isomerase D